MRATILLALTVAFLSGCRSKPPPTAVPPPLVTVVQPAVRRVQSFDEFVARIAAIESVDLRPRVAGYVQDIYFTDGDIVTEGQVLVLIDPRTYQAAVDQAQAALDQAKANEAYSQRDYERYRDALKSGVATPLEVDLAASQLQVNRAAVENAQAALNSVNIQLGFTKVTAPIAGRISRIMVTKGNLVAGDTVLTSIVSITPMYVYFDVDERKLAAYRQLVGGAGPDTIRLEEANLPVFALRRIGGDEFTRRGRIDFVDNRVDPATGTISFRGVFDNDDGGLVSGGFTRVRLPTSQPHDGLLIPEKAVGQDQDRRFVIVVGSDGVARTRPVTLGRSYGPWRVVEKGLSPEEWIVSEGLLRVRPGENVTAQRQGPLDLPAELPAGIPITDIHVPPPTQPATVPTTRPGPTATTQAAALEIRNPKFEIRNKFQRGKTQTPNASRWLAGLRCETWKKQTLPPRSRMEVPAHSRGAASSIAQGEPYSASPGVAVPQHPSPGGASYDAIARQCSSYDKTPLRGLGVIKHLYPGLAEYRSPWAIEDAAPRLWPGTSKREIGEATHWERNVLQRQASRRETFAENSRNSRRKGMSDVAVWSLEFDILEFVSDFEFRISNFLPAAEITR